MEARRCAGPFGRRGIARMLGDMEAIGWRAVEIGDWKKETGYV